jgi:CubicO group peptidase (beta-lactamase class C family)
VTTTRRPRTAWPAAVVVALLVATSCSNDAPPIDAATVTTRAPTTAPPEAETDEPGVPDDGVMWPAPDWQVVDPTDAGVDDQVLDELAGLAEAGGSDCFVVTRDGQIVGEWYWNGTGPDSERETFSVTKSVTATLVGIAQDQGHLDIDQPVSDFVHEWVGTASEGVTIRNLLSNDSGRFQTAESDYLQMAMREPDKTAYAIGLGQEHEIGTVWVYNNAAIQVLEAVLERATGVEVRDYAREHLFEPIGMASTISTDLAGNTLTFMGAQMSCRDMARFGLMHLRDGEWAGTQIVGSEWVAEATQPSTELNRGYGYLWWLVGSGVDEGVPTAPGQGEVPVGSDSYAALGLGGQFIAVIPEHDLVVTRLGPAQSAGFNLFEVLGRIHTDLVEE